MSTTQEVIKFEAGRTYSCNSIGDSNCWWHFEVVRRTAKTLWIRETDSTKIVRRKIRIWDGAETVDPLGNYSMSPSIGANRNVDLG